MAKQRYVRTSFRTDKYVEELTPNEKLIFLYILTNESTNLCGIYEISIKRISFETGLSQKEIKEILEKFTNDKRVFYIDGFIGIVNYIKHQVRNPSTLQGINRELEAIPKSLIEKLDKLSQTVLGRKQPVSAWSTLPYLTLPNQTEPNLTIPDITETTPLDEKIKGPTYDKGEYIQKMRAVETKGKFLVGERNKITGKNDLMDETTQRGFSAFIYEVDTNDYKKRVELYKKCKDLIDNHKLGKYLLNYYQIQNFTIGNFIKNINIFDGTVETVFQKITSTEYFPRVRRSIEPPALKQGETYYLSETKADNEIIEQYKHDPNKQAPSLTNESLKKGLQDLKKKMSLN